MIYSLLLGEEWCGLRSNESEVCNNPEESGQTSGLSHDFPDKFAQHYALIRKNTRFPGQTAMFVSCMFNKIIARNFVRGKSYVDCNLRRYSARKVPTFVTVINVGIWKKQ
jgi:hypothetical protein